MLVLALTWIGGLYEHNIGHSKFTKLGISLAY